MVTFISPTIISPTPDDWRDVDLDTYSCPVDCVGAIIKINGVNGVNMGGRKNGSTDTRLYLEVFQCTFIVGCDANHVIELYTETSMGESGIFTLIGFLSDADAAFETNSISKATSSTGSWQDIDCSANAPASTPALIFSMYQNQVASEYAFGLRCNGSTDNRTATSVNEYAGYQIIGCDANRIAEQYIANTNQDLYYHGYLKTNVTMNTNATDVSLGSTNAYQDLTALPSGAIGGIFEVTGVTGNAYNVDIRKNGSSDIHFLSLMSHIWLISECDTNRVCEGKIDNTGVDFFVVGYFTSSGEVTDPEGSLLGGKLIRGGLLLHGVLGR
jgi:hypothetical protein